MAILLVIDFYVFKGVKTAASGLVSGRAKQFLFAAYWVINLCFIAAAYYAILTWNRNENPRGGIFVILAGVFVLLTVPKLVFAFFLLIEDAYRLLRGGIISSSKLLGADNDLLSMQSWVGRRQFISRLGMGVAAIPFLSIIYGLAKGKYNYKVHRVTATFKDLPEAFNGFTITQISDVHAGSFDDADAVQKGIDLINNQQSDMIVFTGDMVNNFAHEMEPWVPMFASLKAPYGKYSVTGNHDYGDYAEWDSAEKKQKNFEAFKNIHQQIGFKLLLNENTYITKGEQRIALLGIENWGKGGFSKYGDFSKTLNGIDEKEFKILLSHDPSHWDEQVIPHNHHIHLSMAGHTHGMQFGVEIPGIKWSPVKYRYPRWAGLYEQNEKYLYVNRGFGFIGFPGRVGIWPEVTVITLQKA